MLFNKKFSKELFKNPSSEYRGTPFWAWNNKLEKEDLLWQIEELKNMGLGGFHIHCRSGLTTEYLSNEFMDLVKACTDKAEKEQMLCWLYDEDRWPSGAAGGIVTKDHKYRARYLLFTAIPYEKWKRSVGPGDESAMAGRNNKGELIGRYEIILKQGLLQSYRLLADDDKCSDEGREWFAYLEIADESPWFNNQAYINTLDKKAIERFVEVTHERYKEIVGDKFGGVIPAIFTDEPQFTRKTTLGFAEDVSDLIIPYTDTFEADFTSSYGESFLTKLPEVFWNRESDLHALHRYRYHDFVSELFATSFADTVGNWCKENNIMLTGHMMEEPTLESQSKAIGDCMRSYRSFQLPGIDMLCDSREYSTAKQAQSAARQYGCPGVLSELYGVTNWDFDFRGHKLQGDWQAALGINVRVHHLSWVSMEGDAKRDYPASISYQSPWYNEYSYVEDHFARVHTAMTQGDPKVNIGVIHPIESYWLQMGPDEQSGTVKEEMETNFNNTIEWLLHEHLDFDFICESLLPDQAEYSENDIPNIGKMQYETILVPDCRTIRSTTLNFLKKAAAVGCRIIFSGNVPKMLDARPDNSAVLFAESVKKIPHSRSSLKQILEPSRTISIKEQNGMESNRHIYQMREEGEYSWLFIAPSRKAEHPDTAWSEKIRITIQGLWTPELLDSINGEITKADFSYGENQTTLENRMYEHDSLLFRLKPGRGSEPGQAGITAEDVSYGSERSGFGLSLNHALDIPSLVPISLSEDNVLLLDMAEYALDGEDWQKCEELLRINSTIRERLGWPSADTHACQPWAMPEYSGKGHSVSLRFTIKSEIELAELHLALEKPAETSIQWNGIAIEPTVCGWYTDKSIKKVALPGLKKGSNTLEMRFSYTPVSTIEWSYLLGSFGVSVIGKEALVTHMPETLSFGDWTGQGLPFYGGNVDYHIPVDLEAGSYILETPQFRNPLLSLSVDDQQPMRIAYAPYQAEFEIESPGRHTLCLRAYGNRVNSFGPVHNCDPHYSWFGPSAWVTDGRSWSYEYQLKKTGVLISPRLFKK